MLHNNTVAEVSTACAVATGATVWSNDADLNGQGLVETYSTSDVIDWFDTREWNTDALAVIAR